MISTSRSDQKLFGDMTTITTIIGQNRYVVKRRNNYQQVRSVDTKRHDNNQHVRSDVMERHDHHLQVSSIVYRDMTINSRSDQFPYRDIATSRSDKLSYRHDNHQQ
jgi:hypothetical protein